MNVTRISVENFRNLKKTEIFPDKNVNLICGDNAQGKTNLMEALWLFTGARSFRSVREGDFIAFGAQSARLGLDFFDGQRQRGAEMGFSHGERRQARLGGVKLESASRLAGEFQAVVFSPVHMSLVKDGPSVRRRFIDTAVFQIMPRYADMLENYSRVLRQRNALLKDIRINSSLLDLLDVFDMSLAKLSAAVYRARSHYIRRARDHASQAYKGISRGREELDLRYVSGISAVPGPELPDEADYGRAAAYQDALTVAVLERLSSTRGEDIRGGVTSCGPHRDDLEVLVDGISAKNFGSQGQQRSCVLSLKLAESIIIEEVTGQAPVILLDDVMSELDAARRDYLLHSLDGRQVFITCCDMSAVRGVTDGGCFYVAGGEVSQRQAGNGE